MLSKYSVFLIVVLSFQFSSVFAGDSNMNTDALEFNGFLEARVGVRITEDVRQKDASIAEVRLQLDTEQEFNEVILSVVTDFVYDPVLDVYPPDLQSGEGVVDLRQLNIVMSPVDFMDIKLGRQLLTWGTGDLLFINDLFAKDWNSFLIGRDVEYLKAPTDAIKVSMFFNVFNVDVVYTPVFGSDRYIDGNRITFFDRMSNTFRGRDQSLSVDKPDNAFSDDELSLRLYRSFGANEAALYYYHGFWKSPAGVSPLTGEGLFPVLEVYGASIRGAFAGGIGYAEVGLYESEDSAASNPLSRNSELRLLMGYERELASEFKGALQYYVEARQDYDDYVNSLPIGSIVDDKTRQVMTLRLTKLMLQQDLNISLFNFYSTTDKDGLSRFIVSYKLSDDLKIESGLNYFYGKDKYTFYAQFEDSSNIYFSIHHDF